MKLKTLKEAEKYLLKYIPKESAQMFPGELGLKRAKYFLKLLGDPQNGQSPRSRTKLKVIHIAGTSGKGSTAYLTSLLLKSQGFKVGLTLSPHLLDIRERIQVNNELISEVKFVNNLNNIVGVIDSVSKSQYGAPSYFEILIALAFYTFLKEKVDYAIIETGMGGLLDGTNVITSGDKLVILTRIGHDHTQILGSHLADIATQKAGIIKSKNITISAPQVRAVSMVFDKVAKDNQTSISYLQKNQNFKNIKVSEKGTSFKFNFKDLTLIIKLGLIGDHQAENCALALSALWHLGKRDSFPLETKKILEVLAVANFPGRFEIFHEGEKTIILDGAHNPQKMKSFIKTLIKVYPQQKFDFLLAFKVGKDSKKIIQLLKPVVGNVVVTNFFTTNQDLAHLSQESSEVTKLLKNIGTTRSRSIPNQEEAFRAILGTSQNVLVITGSLYFIGEIYHLVGRKL
ncbi:MAG: Mur ligase family protein [Candidatus Daviesbacteria bacterium]|nr:Mur ligase family protein [Candidatus Daviesbacteria bacterium]